MLGERMTEALYRGKRTDNWEWVYGYLGVSRGKTQIYVPFTEEEEKANKGHIFSLIGGLWHTVIPETVGQYVRNDVNGNRAFVGDIIKNDLGDEVGVIRFGEYRQENDTASTCHVGFYVEWHGDKFALFLRKDVGYWLNHYPVVGNIHDNPELLEVK